MKTFNLKNAVQANSKKDSMKALSQADLIWPGSFFMKFKKKVLKCQRLYNFWGNASFCKKCFGRSVVVNTKLIPNVYENIVHICNNFTKYFENRENGPIGILCPTIWLEGYKDFPFFDNFSLDNKKFAIKKYSFFHKEAKVKEVCNIWNTKKLLTLNF